MSEDDEKLPVMYDTILIPTDGSTSAMRGAKHGVELAAEIGAEVHALYVIQDATNPWNRDSLDDQMGAAEEWGNDQTQKVADMAAEHGVECVQETTVNKEIPVGIYEYIEEEGIDSVVMGSGFRGSLGGLFGSTAEKVVRITDKPVTIVSLTD